MSTPKTVLVVLAVVTLILVTLSAVVTALLSSVAGPGSAGNTAQSEAPANMEDFVLESDVIVSGTVISGTFLGYSFSGFNARDELIIDYTDAQDIPLATAAITPPPMGTSITVYDPQLGALPYSTYRVLVDHGYKGSIGVGEEFSVIMSGDMEFGNADLELLPCEMGQRYLFAVALYEGDNYGLRFGKSSRLLIDPPTVRNTDFATSIIGFSSETGVNEFLAELEDTIENL